MDEPAALRPIEEASDAIRRLREYQTTAELASAIDSVWLAVDRSLRLRLRADTSAPDDDRLTALSQESSLDAVVQSLRARELVSLQLAGTVHELQAAADRARQGNARPADADLALRTVSRLREELAVAPRPADPEEAGPAQADPEEVVLPEREGRWIAWVAAGLAALGLLLLALVITRDDTSTMAAATAAFRAGRLDSAAVEFQRVLEDRPEDVSALLYLGRIYRRQERRPQAADVLGRAARIAPADPDVRRELGHLFMDLRQPRAAVAQYERAVEQEPDEMRNWMGLIRALRSAGDPRAERLLRDAPPEVQAALGDG